LLGLGGLLASRLLRLLGLRSLLGTGSERKSCQGDPDDKYSRELHMLSFLFLWFGSLWEPAENSGGRAVNRGVVAPPR
jgi:hypothetical protein